MKNKFICFEKKSTIERDQSNQVRNRLMNIGIDWFNMKIRRLSCRNRLSDSTKKKVRAKREKSLGLSCKGKLS